MRNGRGVLLEARIRNGGRVFSRQYENITPEKVRSKVQKAGLGNIISIKKVHLWDKMGTIDRLDLRSVISPMGAVRPERDNDILLDDTSIEEIVLGKKKPRRLMRDKYGRK